MGSKRKLADKIVSTIRNRHTEATEFYDVFGGGGAISFEALKYNWNVNYNELNKHIYLSIKYLKENDSLGKEFYSWYSRDDFLKALESEPSYLTGFLMCCWSFGSKQGSYLYGKEIENDKMLAHNIIVDKCIDSAKQLGFDLYENLFKIKGIQNRRLAFCSYYKNQNIRFDIQHLERAQVLERIQGTQLRDRLELTNLSFEKLHFKSNSIIYCDPPYKGTTEYKEGGFNHDDFFEWFANLPYPAYLSEYNAPFEMIESYSHRSTLSATNNSKRVSENLYWNGKGEVNNYKLF